MITTLGSLPPFALVRVAGEKCACCFRVLEHLAPQHDLMGTWKVIVERVSKCPTSHMLYGALLERGHFGVSMRGGRLYLSSSAMVEYDPLASELSKMFTKTGDT